MAGKKSKGELESIRGDVRLLTEAVWALRDQVSFNGAAAAAVASSSGNGASRATPVDRGATSVAGFVEDKATGAELTWSLEISAAAALTSGSERTVRILAAIGHRQRLAILTALIESPSTVADLVTRLDLGTTGAAYHHLNVLQAAGLVSQPTRGTFYVPPDQTGVIVSILASTQVAETVSTSRIDD